jgi:phosphoglycolate phosphatase
MARPATRIVFDLDGTLVQTRVASWEVFRDVQAEFGLGLDTEEKYFALLEGNLFESLREACPDEKTADAVSARFLEELENRYHPDIIPGMVDVVHALASRATLAVLSSNATSVIRRVLATNGLQFCFSHVFGGDTEPDKSVGLRRFLADAAQGVGRRCAAPYDEGSASDGATHDDTVLVTDTTGDAAAAIAAGVRVVGVSWGMHTAEELVGAGAEFVAVWPQELIAYLRPDGPDADSCALDVGTRVPAVSTFSGAADVQRSELFDAAGALSAAVDVRRGRRGQKPLERSAAPHVASGPTCGCDVATDLFTPRSGGDSVSVATRDELLAAMRATL